MGFFENLAGSIPFIGPAFQQTNADNNQRQADYDSRVQSDRQMEFQREMSNTAHQREVKDLQAAGLNPILSAGGNGSSTPAGSSSTSSAAPQIHMPDMLAYGISLKQLEQTDQKLAIDKANSASAIAKNLTDQDLTKAKTILSQKGMLKAELEGTAADIIHKLIKSMIKDVKTPAIKGDRKDTLNQQYQQMGMP